MNLFILYATFLALLAPASGTELASDQEEALHIGLLIPDPSYTSVVAAAQKAIDEVNQEGGHGDLPFKLIIRITEGPWGAGSKESVSLVYDDQVLAMLGSLDGRNAHLAEQVAAKSHLVYMETRATDPTLSQAYVPWFFRVVPNDDQQSRALLEQIEKNGGGQVAILSQDQYDTRYAVKSLIKYAARKNGHSPLVLQADSIASVTADLLAKLEQARIKHLVIPFYSESSLQLIVRIREHMPLLSLYGTLALCAGLEKEDLSRKELQGMTLVHSYSSEMNEEQFNDPYAFYTYEGIKLILNAIQKVGSDRESIKEYLYTVKLNKENTGALMFDDMGNRCGSIHFSKIDQGSLMPADY